MNVLLEALGVSHHGVHGSRSGEGVDDDVLDGGVLWEEGPWDVLPGSASAGEELGGCRHTQGGSGGGGGAGGGGGGGGGAA
eukprot:5126032-Prorocentrum_lima.AAC.1